MTFRLAGKYAEARRSFREAAVGVGGAHRLSPYGSLSACWRGADDRRRRLRPRPDRATLVVLAGTHGVERYAVSALPLELIAQALPKKGRGRFSASFYVTRMGRRFPVVAFQPLEHAVQPG